MKNQTPPTLPREFFVFVFWVLSWWTSLLGELAGGGYVAVAFGVGDRWQVTGDRWQVTGDKWHVPTCMVELWSVRWAGLLHDCVQGCRGPAQEAIPYRGAAGAAAAVRAATAAVTAVTAAPVSCHLPPCCQEAVAVCGVVENPALKTSCCHGCHCCCHCCCHYCQCCHWKN